ncbi:MAG: multiheme c-type cytochrome [Sandaracinaceae bacterium]
MTRNDGTLIRSMLFLTAAALGGCDTSERPAQELAPPIDDPVRPPETSAEPAPLDAATRLPARPDLYPESQVRLVPDDPRDAAHLRDVGACEGCHPDVVSAWRSSPHARASFDNPWYRQAVDTFRAEAGYEASRFCAGCHDPVLLLTGAMEREIEPFDPNAHAGVTCLVCHGIREARPDGSGSYTLRTGPVPLPDPADPEQVAEHVRALTPSPLRTVEMCATCHRGFLGPEMGNPHHLPGVDDVTAYFRSGFATSTATRIDQPVEPASCQGCHMPMAPGEHDFARDDDGLVHSHRFAGAHTTMAAASRDDAQLEAVRARLMDAVRIDVPQIAVGSRAHRPADGAPVRGGQDVVLDVVVRNLGTGHRFPGGTRDAQDTWIEVEVHDADGVSIAEAGTREAREPDPTAHRLRATVVDEEGTPQDRHLVQRFRAAVFDRTIAPRDAIVVRYSFHAPDELALPLRVDARLVHRRHPVELARAACEASRTERGRRFGRMSRALGRRPIDPCLDQPLTTLASALVYVGEGSPPRDVTLDPTPLWRRMFDHALALSSDVQEHLDGARPSLDDAYRSAPDERARAMVIALRARVEGLEGRLDAALDAVADAEAILGERAALHRLRGDAYAQVWRWDDAAAAYLRAAEAAPLDDSRWIDLARALGSAGRDREALDAAQRGLARVPRDESLLRSQYLAVSHLSLPTEEAAHEAYLAHRSVDELSALRLRCGERYEACALERLPVHTHPMRAGSPESAPTDRVREAATGRDDPDRAADLNRRARRP